MSKLFCGIIIPLLMYLAMIPTHAQYIPVSNSGFETGGTLRDPIPGWIVGLGEGTNATIQLDGMVAHSGRRSARITNRSDRRPFFYALLSSSWIGVQPRKTYVARCWVRGRSVRNSYFAVAFQGGGEQRHELPSEDFEWRRVSFTFSTPDDCRRISLHIASDDLTDGLWIDDISLEFAQHQLTDLSERRYAKPFPGIFPRSNGSLPRHLYLYDTSADSLERRRAVAALQGLVNRAYPRLYVIHTPEPPGDDHEWLRYMREKGYTYDPVPIESFEVLLKLFRTEVKGAIVPDPELPGSVHAATMLSGLLSGLPMSAEQANRLQLPILEDLRGRWKRNVDAYRYVYDRYWPRMNHHILAWEHPLMDYQGTRDYMVEFNIFTFWLSGEGDKEKGAAPEAEEEFINEVLANTPANIPVMGWPSFETGNTALGITEYACVRWLSEYGKFVPGTGFCSNLSVHTAIRPSGRVFVQPALASSKSRTRTAERANRHGVYLSLNIMDSGDALWYWQRYQRKIWADADRGTLPIGWGMNTTLIETLPLVMQWYYEHATPNDTFFAAVSGLGYMNTQVYASRFRAMDRERIWSGYARLTDDYRRKAGMEGIALYNGGWNEPTVPATVLERFVRASRPDWPLRYILADLGRHDSVTPDRALEMVLGTPVFHTLTRYQVWSRAADVQRQQRHPANAWLLNEILTHTPSTRPATMTSMAISWYYTPSWLKDLQSRLPPEYKVVSLHDLLLR